MLSRLSCSVVSILWFCVGFAFNLGHGIIPIQFGGANLAQGQAQNVNIQGLVGNHYTLSSRLQNKGLVGVGYYLSKYDKCQDDEEIDVASQRYHTRRNNNDSWQDMPVYKRKYDISKAECYSQQASNMHLYYGIDLFYFGAASVSGEIIQEQLYANLNYKYDVQQFPIYLAIKANINLFDPNYNLVLDLGMGPNFIHTSNYTEVPLTSYSIPANNTFAPNNSTSFSVTAGIGIRLNNIIGHCPLELGYRFFYLGSGQLQANNNQLLNTLKTGNMYANALVFTVTL